MIEKQSRRKSLKFSKNGTIKYEYTLEDLQFLDTNVPKEHEDVVMNRLNAITPLLKLQHRTFEDVKNQSKNTGISSKTLYNWMKQYKEDGIAGLIPQHHKSGRRQKKYSPEIKTLFDQCIEDYILNPNMPRIVDCWNQFQKEAFLRGYSSSQLPKRVTFYSMYKRKLEKVSKMQSI